MFEFRPNYEVRAKKLAEKAKKRVALKEKISAAKTVHKLKEVLLLALEEGEL